VPGHAGRLVVLAVTFALRRTEPYGVVHLAGRAIKAYEVTAADDPVDANIWQAALGAAETTLADVPGTSPGFVILHLGEDSVWLLVHWWAGDICCQRLLTASLADPSVFRHAPTGLMACVWELHVIDHERRAWSRNVLGGEGGTPAYLASRLRVVGGDPL
jgi:hypothetical protein